MRRIQLFLAAAACYILVSACTGELTQTGPVSQPPPSADAAPAHSGTPDAAPMMSTADAAPMSMADGGAAGATLDLYASCTTNAQCKSGLCFTFNANGPHCTKACTVATQAVDCPAPSSGCNGMGVCKIN